MRPSRPKRISAREMAARERRVARIARELGFVGRVEYRHVHSQAGGAQFGLGATAEQDLLIVYAEAFERDANPEEFSLEAIIAHECGHWLLARNRRLLRNLPPDWSGVSEEIVASLVASLLVRDERDRNDLFLKGLFEAVRIGIDLERATTLASELRALLETTL